jgi:hypothetical protein
MKSDEREDDYQEVPYLNRGDIMSDEREDDYQEVPYLYKGER